MIQANFQNGIIRLCTYMHILPRTSVASFIFSKISLISFVYLHQRLRIDEYYHFFSFSIRFESCTSSHRAILYVRRRSRVNSKMMFQLNDKILDDPDHLYFQLFL